MTQNKKWYVSFGAKTFGQAIIFCADRSAVSIAVQRRSVQVFDMRRIGQFNAALLSASRDARPWFGGLSILVMNKGRIVVGKR